MSPAPVLVCSSSGPLPGGPVMSPVKCLDIFFKLEVVAVKGNVFHTFCHASFEETFNLKKCSPVFAFSDIYSLQCFLIYIKPS